MDRGHLSHSVSTRLVGRVMCGLRSLREEWNEANKEGKSVWDEGTAYIKHTGIKQLRRLPMEKPGLVNPGQCGRRRG